MKVEYIEEKLHMSEKTVIYGAGVVAFNISEALKELYHIRIETFYVTDSKDAGKGFGGIEAYAFLENMPDKDALILVATPAEYHGEILACLERYKYREYLLIDSGTEYALMGKYFQKRGFCLSPENTFGTLADCGDAVTVYMAKSIYDKKLGKDYDIYNYVIPVQAGAALTAKRISAILDTDGKTISERNRDYSELTVTYWAWKNSKSRYVGICHYRRIFRLSPGQLAYLLGTGTEVILPLPYLCKRNASEQYFRYIRKDDFEIFCSVLKQKYPESFERMMDCLNWDYFYNYNMLIARRDVFDAYCEFLFGVLFEVENFYKCHEITRKDRYLGYLGEILTSIFFCMNREKFHIVHAERIWMV